ncbi:hypothetical protein [Kitasatospora viridis]|uniref:CBM6 domain-containing protein n=1 Tax=Kitasatospora viridis TaxID=281105 RepID=A0A561UGG5_9ACTN|nr:hypothetical protein [Kitasatospora viridis]TWF98453.1 hypothetical protein FHX73_112262 [Kitasatospora viridis]
MTADSQGPEESAGGVPAEDDPFGYLYRPAAGEAGAEQPPPAPRTAYRPMEVGRAQYGAQTPRQQPFPPGPQGPPPGYPRAPLGAPGGHQAQGQPGYGAESTAQLPHQQSRYAERSRPQPGEDVPRGRGKGPVIGVVAVVAAIAIGAGIALSGGDGKTKDNAGPGPTGGAGHTTSASSAGPSTSGSPSGSPSASGGTTASNGFADASQAQAGGGAVLGSGVKGAVSADGSYLTMQQGSTATFSVTVPTAGVWKVWFHYGNTSGGQVKAAVTVNGTDHPGGTTFKSWNTGGDPAQSWSYTWVSPQLQAGTNTIVVTTSGGPVLLDQMAVTGMDVSGNYPSPSGAAPAPSSS